MTFKEKLKQERPGDYEKLLEFTCPTEYEYEKPWSCFISSTTCEECWNREMPVERPRILLHTLLDTVLDVQESGDYASIDISNHGNQINVYHMLSSFQNNKDFDYSTFCSADDTEALQEIIDYFNTILERKRK